MCTCICVNTYTHNVKCAFPQLKRELACFRQHTFTFSISMNIYIACRWILNARQLKYSTSALDCYEKILVYLLSNDMMMWSEYNSRYLENILRKVKIMCEYETFFFCWKYHPNKTISRSKKPLLNSLSFYLSSQLHKPQDSLSSSAALARAAPLVASNGLG